MKKFIKIRMIFLFLFLFQVFSFPFIKFPTKTEAKIELSESSSVFKNLRVNNSILNGKLIKFVYSKSNPNIKLIFYPADKNYKPAKVDLWTQNSFIRKLMKNEKFWALKGSNCAMFTICFHEISNRGYLSNIPCLPNFYIQPDTFLNLLKNSNDYKITKTPQVGDIVAIMNNETAVHLGIVYNIDNNQTAWVISQVGYEQVVIVLPIQELNKGYGATENLYFRYKDPNKTQNSIYSSELSNKQVLSINRKIYKKMYENLNNFIRRNPIVSYKLYGELSNF